MGMKRKRKCRFGTDLKRRLLSRREIVGPDGCWEWRGSRLPKGYGLLAITAPYAPIPGKTNYLVHRVSAHVFLGFDLSSRLLICHRCDNPSCFNPGHLFPGTQADNQADMRSKKPEPNRSFPRKLTEDDVIRIRLIYSEGGHTNRSLAEFMNLGKSTIQAIVTRKIWASC